MAWAVVAANIGGAWATGRKVFFFEKKNQKTFAQWAGALWWPSVNLLNFCGWAIFSREKCWLLSG
jgi:hypothetical protein